MQKFCVEVITRKQILLRLLGKTKRKTLHRKLERKKKKNLNWVDQMTRVDKPPQSTLWWLQKAVSFSLHRHWKCTCVHPTSQNFAPAWDHESEDLCGWLGQVVEGGGWKYVLAQLFRAHLQPWQSWSTAKLRSFSSKSLHLLQPLPKAEGWGGASHVFMCYVV